jgi:hypothetical protein
MFCRQPTHRVHKIRHLCQKKRVSLEAALSLRRHHMKRLNPARSMSQLQLGSFEDIKESANLFEQAVATFLRDSGVEFYSEADQKAAYKERRPGEPFPPTPDFVLTRPVRIKKYVVRKKNKRILEEKTVCWIEAKMFYGASTIEQGDDSAVGNLLQTARKYVNAHGEGAIVFMQGYGDRLARELQQVVVMALDCSGGCIDTESVQAHQRTWCADQNGNILP